MTQENNSNLVEDVQRKNAIRQTFDTVASAYGLGGARFFIECGQFMAGLLPLQGNEHVLDVACGTGATTIPLAQALMSGKVSAVDLSSNMLAQAEHKAQSEKLSNIEFHNGDMTALPFADQSFDHALCSFGLFFVEDMDALLAHIRSKVKSGGKVLISGFCGDSFMPCSEMLFDQLREYGIDVPQQPFSWKRIAEPEQLHDLFTTAGMHNVHITRKSMGYKVSHEQWWEVVWNAGFRSVVAQLDDQLDAFKREHYARLESISEQGEFLLNIDVNFSYADCP